jgi:hypothetical protein
MKAPRTMTLTSALAASQYNTAEKYIGGALVTVTSTDTGEYAIEKYTYMSGSTFTKREPSLVLVVRYYGHEGWKAIN